MNPWTNRTLKLIACSALSACTIGNGMICGPQTPIAYCDREAYQRLAHPKPYIENWEKPGADAAARGQDSAACGGGSTDRAPSFGPGFIREMQQPGESENATYVRLFRDWQRCMIKKGYRYTGYCSSDYAKVAPACGAP
jgi:hypothetical protein